MSITAIEPYFIHRFVAANPGDKRTLLLLHGTGGNEMDLLPMGTLIAPGAALISPRGRVLEDGMARFFRRIGEGVFDIDDLIKRTNELADFVQSASKTYGFNLCCVIGVGYSNGANIAASLLLLRPEVLSAAVLFRPMVPLVPKNLPDLSGKPILVIAGRSDSMVPQQNTEKLVDLLKDAGADVVLEWHPGSHSLSDKDIDSARHWLGNLSEE